MILWNCSFLLRRFIFIVGRIFKDLVFNWLPSKNCMQPFIYILKFWHNKGLLAYEHMWDGLWRKLKHKDRHDSFFLCLLSRRAFFPFLDFPCKPSLWTLTHHIHHICLRSAVSEQALLRCQHSVKLCAWIMLFFLSSRSSDGFQGLHMCQCCRGREMDATHRRQEIQVDDTTHESLPLRPLLSSND